MTAAIAMGQPARIPTPVVIEELHYAASLLQRCQRAIDKEFAVLRAAGVVINLGADLVTIELLNMAVQCHMLAVAGQLARQSMDTCPRGAA